MRKRDPLVVGRESLTGGGVDETQLDAVDVRVKTRMGEIVRGSLAAPFPSSERPGSQYKEADAA